MKTLLDKYHPVFNTPDENGNIPQGAISKDGNADDNKETEKWQTQVTSLEAKLTELSQKLADVEGRPNPNADQLTAMEAKLTELETKLSAAQTELSEAKARREAKASRRTQSPRKTQLAQNNQQNKGVEENPAPPMQKRKRGGWV